MMEKGKKAIIFIDGFAPREQFIAKTTLELEVFSEWHGVFTFATVRHV